MKVLLWKASLRHLRQHPWQLALAVLGVALGVSVVVGIDVANGSAQRAFELSSDAVAGRATHRISNAGSTLPEEVYRRLRVELGLELVAPVVEAYVGLPGPGGEVLLLLGVDPLAEAPFRDFSRLGPDTGIDLGGFLVRPGAALISTGTAANLGLEPGESFDVDVGGALRELELVGTLRAAGEQGSSALADLVVVDIATAQEVLGLNGLLSRVDLVRPPGLADDEFENLLRPVLPEGVELQSVRSEASTVEQMTRAFRLNLQALSLLALLCGAFLIYNTMTFAVVQRRPLLAILRAIGATRRQIFILILGEALLIGLAGTLIGELLGFQLGKMLVGRVTQTINDLYFAINVRDVAFAPWTLVKGAVLGLVATLFAALTPSVEATASEPREAMARSELEVRVHRLVPVLAAVGGVLLVVGGVLLLLPGKSLWLGFLGLFSILLGFAMTTPLLTRLLMAGLTPLAGALSGQLGRMATRGVATTLSRTGIAVAALMMALSVTVGVDLMVRSFRATVTNWLAYALPADVYFSVFTTAARRFSPGGATLDPMTIDGIEQADGVAATNLLRHFLTSIDGEEVRAVALELSAESRRAFVFRRGDPDAIWDRIETGEAVMISEPLAYRRGLAEDDTVTLGSPAGTVTLPIGGVFYDYSTDQGLLMLDRGLYRRLWSDDGATALSVHVEEGATIEAVTRTIRRLLPEDLRVRSSSNAQLRTESLEIFDRTFLITGVLRTLAVIVAFVGVLSALLALQLERTRELGLMRACGLTPGQLWSLVTQQTGLMGLTAGLLSIPVGVSMAAIMVYVINRRSFGWSLDLELFPLTLLQAVLVGVASAVLAGLYPAWRMSRTRPSEALRDE
jgi:putative ABC transport system permease protein